MKGYNEQVYLQNFIKPGKAGQLWLSARFTSAAVNRGVSTDQELLEGNEGGDQLRAPLSISRIPLPMYFISLLQVQNKN